MVIVKNLLFLISLMLIGASSQEYNCSTDTSNCREDGTTEICSGYGQCLCNSCVCNGRYSEKTHGDTSFFGKYCECDPLSCLSENETICSGNGNCVCGVCACLKDWAGHSCECSLKTDSCLDLITNEICNDRGLCICGRCECEPSFYGEFCDECETCPKKCPARISNTVDFKCDYDGVKQNCSQTMREGTVVTMECKPYHIIRAPSLRATVKSISCIDGIWTYPIIQCEPEYCPAMISNRVDFKCYLNGVPQNCSEMQKEGTVATMECKLYHKIRNDFSSPIERLTVCSGGRWINPILKCEAECGIIAKARPLVMAGLNASIDIHPWHVGVYRRENNKIIHICGGTLINPVTVLSAAHCFSEATNGKPHPKNIYLIAAGKNYRDLNDENDKVTEEQREIQDIVIHKEFRAYTRLFRHDIALIKLTEAFNLSSHIALICVDYSNKFYDETLDRLGTVVGWGVNELDGRLGDPLLKKINVPIWKREDCEYKVPTSFKPFLQDDKICAGRFNGSGVCTGDSGGGLITKNQHDIHFIRGITSSGPVLGMHCNHMQVATYTKISKYIDFINKAKEWY